jgi:hypothetical protein
MYTNLPKSFGYTKEIPLQAGFAALAAGKRKFNGFWVIKL